MLFQLVNFLNTLVIVLLFAHQVYPWSYNDKNEWYKTYPNCSGDMQSPINLVILNSNTFTPLPKMKYINFHKKPVTLQLKNNGHTVTITSMNNTKPAIEGGNLPDGKFLLEQMHFHWGATGSRGSEHTINGNAYSLELHMVFYNEKYKDVDEAKFDPNGLAVLGLLFKEASFPNCCNNKIELILKKLPSVKKPNAETILNDVQVTIFDIFEGINRNKFFTYEGSLTTPPCSEAVTWTVFSDVLLISRKTMKQFRQLYDEHGDLLVDNYRNIQPLEDREVYYRLRI